MFIQIVKLKKESLCVWKSQEKEANTQNTNNNCLYLLVDFLLLFKLVVIIRPKDIHKNSSRT